MNDDRNNPKPLPDDFGMTLPNIRVPKQNRSSESDLPTTNLRPTNANYGSSQPPTEDFGTTIPNFKAPNQVQPPPNNFDLTVPNLKQNPQSNQSKDASFDRNPGLTLNNFEVSKEEPNFQATIPYLPPPEKSSRDDRRQTEFNAPPVAAPILQKPKKNAVPLWAWLLGGGLTAFLFLILIVAAAIIYWYNTGYTLVVTDAPSDSTIFVDGTRRGVTAPDNATKIYGLKAGERRAIKITHDNCDDFNGVIEGNNGETKTLIAQMNCQTPKAATPAPKPASACTDDPRVCDAEARALDALDRLKAPFTADDLVRALNLHIINFESNKSDIPSARKRFLERATEKFKQLPTTSVIEIGGHTDNVGGADANLILSQDRAKAVRAVLVTFGVEPKMLTTKGYGSTKPKADNATDNGKFVNRRIEYSVVAR